VASDYQRALGERLRAIRSQQSLTLQQVEENSDGRWKAVVIGSYERGDRAISVAKLAELATFYGVPIVELLPDPTPTETAPEPDHVVLDLHRLGIEDVGPELAPVARFASTVQLRRGDYNGRVLTVRTDDLRALASALGLDSEELIQRLSAHGAIAS